MRRRGWNPPRLSSLTEGTVSASSIRAWVAGKSAPRRYLALEIAKVLGPVHGATLLRLWDLPDLADGFLEEMRGMAIGANGTFIHPLSQHQGEAAIRSNLIEYSGEPLSDEATDIIATLIWRLQRLSPSSSEPPS